MDMRSGDIIQSRPIPLSRQPINRRTITNAELLSKKKELQAPH